MRVLPKEKEILPKQMEVPSKEEEEVPSKEEEASEVLPKGYYPSYHSGVLPKGVDVPPKILKALTSSLRKDVPWNATL